MLRLFAGAKALPAFVCLLIVYLVPSVSHAEIRAIDLAGRTVVLPAPARRVALGFDFEDYLAIVGPDAAERLVAISRPVWEAYRPGQWRAYVKAVPRLDKLADIGDFETGTFSVERVVAARPDLVVLAAWQFQSLGAAAAQLDALGVPVAVIDYNAQTPERHVASTLLLGRLMGAEDRAQRLSDLYVDRIKDTRERVTQGEPSRPKVYVELGRGGPSDVGNSYGRGMWAGVIDLAGGTNIAAGQVGNAAPLRPEYVLSSQPDMIMVAGSEWAAAQSVDMGFGVDPALSRERIKGYLGRLGWSDLPAVRTGEVYAMYHGGNRTLYDFAYLRYLAKALHPKAFRDVDPLGELAAFYREYLPIGLDGAFMLRLVEGKEP